VTERRRIGDILLAHGFASEEQLVEASAEQERSGQPLGQILVQHGVITRLELASALAEQWSDQSVSLSLAPLSKPAPRPVLQHNDDDQYAARLQDAVADLARRVHATQPEEAVDERVTDLAERIEATVARTQRLEATLATFADSLEGVTGGVEEAFAGLQGGMSGLALDLARIDSTVAEMLAHPEGPPSLDPAITARLEELSAAVQELTSRSIADDAIHDRVDELATRLETLADDPGLVDLSGLVSDVQAQVEGLAGGAPSHAELERQSDILSELRATVAELALRPVGSPEVDARLERLEASLGEQLAAPDAAVIETLAARIETSIDRQENVRASVEALDARLEEIAALAGRDDATQARVEDLERRLETEAAALVELRRELTDRQEPQSTRRLEKLGDALDSLKRDVASLARETPGERIEQLARLVEELAADRGAHEPLLGRLEALEARLPSDILSHDDLAQALSTARDELRRMVPEPDGRLEQLSHDLDAVRVDLARTREEAATAVPEPDGRIEQLTNDVTALRADLARARYELGQTPSEPDGRVDQLAQDVDAVRQTLSHAAQQPDGRVDQLADELSALRTDLARARDELTHTTPEPDYRIDRLVQDLEAVRAELATSSSEPDGRVDQLADDLAAVRAELAGISPPTTPDPELTHRLEQLSHRIDELAGGQAEQAALAGELRSIESRLAADVVTRAGLEQALTEIRDELARSVLETSSSDESAGALAQLEERLGAAEALSARVEGLAQAVEAATRGELAEGTEDLRREIDGRLEEIARTVEERLSGASSSPAAPSEAATGLEEELERTRMAIERFGLHLGEHDRALAEMRGTRSVAQRLDELAARVDDLAAAGQSVSSAPNGSPGHSYVRRSLEPDLEIRSLIRRLEDVEETAHAGREKLMNRLERMASSIDWRLQRLEAGDAE